LGKKFAFTANDQKLESVAVLADSGRGLSLVMKTNGAESRFSCGYHEWVKGRGTFGTYQNEPVAASAAWLGEDSCLVKLCAYETPFYATIKLHFDGDQVFFDSEQNVGFGSTKRPQLAGQAN